MTLLSSANITLQPIGVEPIDLGQFGYPLSDMAAPLDSPGCSLSAARCFYLIKLRYEASASICWPDSLLEISGIGGPAAA